MKTLFEITEAYRYLDALLDESGGEVTPEVEAFMSTLDGALEAKVDGYCALIRQAQANADALGAEAARLHARHATETRKAASLRDRLLQGLKAAGKPKVKTLNTTVWAAKSGSPSIRFEGNPEALPEEFRVVYTEANGRKAREVVKAGGELPPGFTVRYSEYLGMR